MILVLTCTDGQLETQELSSCADVKIFYHIRDSSELSDEICTQCVGIILGTQLITGLTMLQRFPNLKIIVRHGIGFDNVDLEVAGRLGIIVCNVPDYGVEEVADTAMAHILGLFRQTTSMHAAIEKGKVVEGYEEIFANAKGATRIRGKTLGLIGLGKTGMAVALRAKVFGFNAIFCDPYTTPGLDKAIGGLERYKSMEELIQKSDCVSLHCMLTKETKHVINSDTLKLFKKDSFLVNVARGPLIDEEALAAALKDGRLAGAALDVHEHEPFSYNASVLKGAPNLICTPHIAWYSKESFVELSMRAIQTVKQVFSSLKEVDMQRCVNSKFLDKDAQQARWCDVKTSRQ